MWTLFRRGLFPGALKKAAETTQAKNADPSATKPPRRVGVSVVEAYGKEVEPRELEATLRMEYRTKLLNPKWAEAMSKQVRRGAPGGIGPHCLFCICKYLLCAGGLHVHVGYACVGATT